MSHDNVDTIDITRDYYADLGIRRDATPEEANEAFRRKCEQHPHDFEEQLKFGIARSILGDSTRRMAYESSRRLNELMQTQCQPSRQWMDNATNHNHVHQVTLQTPNNDLTSFFGYFMLGVAVVFMIAMILIVL
jgi:DnaJ-class molecular chaperone